MNIKQKMITALLAGIIGVALFIFSFTKSKIEQARSVYQIFLNGEGVGTIANKDELYKIIDDSQKDIKEKFGVSTVYPPNSFEIIEKYTYDTNLTTAKDVYSKMKELDDFTIKAFRITIKPNDEEKSPIIINVTKKEIFESALRKFILAFVNADKLDKYLESNQEDIKDTGSIIEDMHFNEKFTVKEAYISVNDRIFTNDDELTRYLLFGEENEPKYYTVKAGDTIEKVSDDNKLNTEEFLIANPNYASVDSLLAINDQVNVTLINPVVSLTYQLYDVSDEEQYFEKKVVIDNSKPSSYNEVTQAGVTGIVRLTQRFTVTNGEQSQGVETISSETLREKVDQVTTKGRRYTAITGQYINLGAGWGWPTNSGYRITSPYGYRWGKMHDGVDISGTGFNSPIYAANDGVVVVAQPMCKGCSAWSLGNYVIIQHENNYHTMYAHLNKIGVSVGQQVRKGDIIGKMGETGYATGVHLHFSLSIGQPYTNSYRFLNPLSLYK